MLTNNSLQSYILAHSSLLGRVLFSSSIKHSIYNLSYKMFQFTCQFSLQNMYTSSLNFRSIQTVILVLSDTSSFRILEIVLRFPLVLMSLEHNAASLLTYASVSHHFYKNLLSNRTVFCMSNTIKLETKFTGRWADSGLASAVLSQGRQLLDYWPLGNDAFGFYGCRDFTLKSQNMNNRKRGCCFASWSLGQMSHSIIFFIFTKSG